MYDLCATCQTDSGPATVTSPGPEPSLSDGQFGTVSAGPVQAGWLNGYRIHDDSDTECRSRIPDENNER